MSEKIGKELSRQLKAMKRTSKKRLPVIITVEDSSTLDALKEKGFEMTHSFDIINAVSGTLPAAAVEPIARLDQVQQIDYDGQVEALKSDDEEEDDG